MARSLFRNSNFAEYSGVFLLLAMLSLVLLTLDRNTSILKQIRTYGEFVLLDTYALFHGVQEELNLGITGLYKIHEMERTITKLRLEREQLLVRQNIDLPQLEKENSQLRDLLNLTDVYSDGLIVAKQIRSVRGTNDNNLYINIGIKDGVQLSQPVLSAQGIVGQVIEIFDNYCVILPIIHTNHGLSVQISNKLARYIAQGDGEALVIRDLPLHTDIRKGDKVVTTGLGGIYPQLYPVGQVGRIVEKKTATKDIYIEPYTDFNETQFVIVPFERQIEVHTP